MIHTSIIQQIVKFPYRTGPDHHSNHHSQMYTPINLCIVFLLFYLVAYHNLNQKKPKPKTTTCYERNRNVQASLVRDSLLERDLATHCGSTHTMQSSRKSFLIYAHKKGPSLRSLYICFC